MFGKKKNNVNAPQPAAFRPGSARALVVSLAGVDPVRYDGWDGKNGCTGCGIDAARVTEMLRLGGFEVESLQNQNATCANVIGKLQEAARSARNGDSFVFYFAGHGGQAPDVSGDEAPERGGRPGADETLVCYDAELIDDELEKVWLSFPAGSVIYMLSDSCNSGTNYRGVRTQGPSPVRPMQRRTAEQMKARLLHLGGCRDGFTSAGEDDGGAFTKTLFRAWDGGRGPGTWKELHEAVCRSIKGQAPQMNTYGPKAAALLGGRPFAPFGASPAAGEGPALATRGAAGERAPSEQDALNSGELTPTQLIPDQETRDARGRELPISEAQARRAARWLFENFGETLVAKTEGTPFGTDLLTAIVCQETAYFWLPLLDTLEKLPEFADDPGELRDVLVSRCVLDACGDYPGTSRSAFPKNTDEFRARYGAEFTNVLIEEANSTRARRGYGPKRWVYKGYGIFQYDLQFVKEDEDFFRERRWYDFEACLDRCIEELHTKYQSQNGDLWETVRAYNGSGPRARQYRDNVKQFAAWTKDEIALTQMSTSAATRGPGEARRGPLLPSARPNLTQAELAAKLAPYQIDRQTHPVVIVGIRGYFKNMAKPGVNDRGIYDDAIFVDAADGFAAFNGNTDPSRFQPGQGTGKGKGMAKLQPGVTYVHKFDYHGSQVHGAYPAICQRLGELTVVRDGNPPYPDTGEFGINIHKGSYNGTSSLGCQTIHPDQWPAFYALAKDLAVRFHGDNWNKVPIPYVLIEEV